MLKPRIKTCVPVHSFELSKGRNLGIKLHLIYILSEEKVI